MAQQEQLTDAQAVQILNARLSVAVAQRNDAQDRLVQSDAALAMMAQQFQAAQKLLAKLEADHADIVKAAADSLASTT